MTWYVVKCDMFYLRADDFWSVWRSDAERFPTRDKAEARIRACPSLPYTGEDAEGRLRSAPPVSMEMLEWL